MRKRTLMGEDSIDPSTLRLIGIFTYNPVGDEYQYYTAQGVKKYIYTEEFDIPVYEAWPQTTYTINDLFYANKSLNYIELPISPCITDATFALAATTIRKAQVYFCNSNPINVSSMFYYCGSLISVTCKSNPKSKIGNMKGMFRDSSALSSVDLSNLDLSEVSDMSDTFNGCKELTQIKFPSKKINCGESTASMFSDCQNLEKLDLSNFDTSSVVNMSKMFYYCNNLQWLDLSSFTAENVQNTSSMFTYSNKIKYIKCKKSFYDFLMSQNFTNLPSKAEFDLVD